METGKITVSIEFNGMQRHLASAGSITMPIKSNTRVTDALEYLMRQYPHLKMDKNAIIATVNYKMASLDKKLNSNDVVSFLPPIGGG